MDWENLTVHFELSGGARPIAVIRSAAGGGRGEFALSFKEIESLLASGSSWRGFRQTRDLVLATVAAETPEAVGARLYKALFSGRPGEARQRALGRAQAQGNGLRVELTLALNDPGLSLLARLPWELLYDETARHFLFRDRRFLLTRSLEVLQAVSPLAVALPLRVLIALATPAELGPLDAAGEWELIEKAWAGRSDVAITCLRHATLEGLREQLLGCSPQVVHFVGHGGQVPGCDDGGLVLEDGRGGARFVSGPTLADHLTDHDVCLAVLNACGTAEFPQGDGADPFSAAATALIARGLPAVVAMQRPISDRAAIRFSDVFYRRLAAGDPLDVAVTEARLALSTAADTRDSEWPIPVLYLRSRSSRIFAVDGEVLPPSRRLPDVPPVPELFFGRETGTCQQV